MDVWVSCNPTTGTFDPSGTSCVLNRHDPIYSQDPNKRNVNFEGAKTKAVPPGSQIPLDGGGIGTIDFPAASCTALAKMPHFYSGFYWLQPSPEVAAFEGYCEMDSFGGGWLMCYTTSGEVHVSREVKGTVGYGQDGYRADCRHYPFNQVMYVRNTGEDEKAWFSFRGRNALVASRSGYRGRLDESWGAGSGPDGLLFSAHGCASTRTPACIQARADTQCRHAGVVAGKARVCADCFAVRPQRGNASCAPDASRCWCDGTFTAGCSSPAGPPQRTLRLAEVHAAVADLYAGWVVTLTAGTGQGQMRKVRASAGGVCSSAAFDTKASCLANNAVWTGGANAVETESAWDPLPCSNSAIDGYICRSVCSERHPEDGTTCNREVAYGTHAACLANCFSYDPYARTYTIDYTGADGGRTTLVDANGTAGSVTLHLSDVEFAVPDAAAAGIYEGKSLLIGTEVMYVTSVHDDVVRVLRAQNQTQAAQHLDDAAVTVLVDYAVHPRETLPTCSYSCSTRYELRAPSECSALDWACGYHEEGGARRGYSPLNKACPAHCACDTAGTPSCGGNASAGNGCACVSSTSPTGQPLSSPWSSSVLRLASGINTDGCTGAFNLCQGPNPYQGYRLKIGGEERRVVAYSGAYNTVQLDAPLSSPPIPAPSSDPTWSGAAGYSMSLASECAGVYDNDKEKQLCAQTQLYQLMICDNEAGDGFRDHVTSGGFIMSGFDPESDCRKSCEDSSFCEERSSEWYRADSGWAHASGIAFKRNGNREFPIGEDLISVGIRLVDNEGILS